MGSRAELRQQMKDHATQVDHCNPPPRWSMAPVVNLQNSFEKSSGQSTPSQPTPSFSIASEDNGSLTSEKSAPSTVEPLATAPALPIVARESTLPIVTREST